MSAFLAHPSITALVANSSRFTLRNVRDALARLGVRTVVEAQDGAEAVMALGENKPDILILDWSLPVIAAREIVASARDKGRSHAPDMPVLVTMSQPTRKAVQEAVTLRANSILSVPFSPKDLRHRLELLMSEIPPRGLEGHGRA